MLQKPPKKFHARERDAPHLLRAVVPIAKRDLPRVDRLQSAIGDRDAEDIATEVVEYLLTPASGLGMDDPGRRPHRRRRLVEEPGSAESGAYLRAEDDRQRLHRDQEGGVLRRDPLRAVGGEAARRDE